MRQVLLVAATTLALQSPVLADEIGHAHVKAGHHHHSRETAETVSAAEPADTLSPHEARIENLRDSGLSAANDFDRNGNMKQNY